MEKRKKPKKFFKDPQEAVKVLADNGFVFFEGRGYIFSGEYILKDNEYRAPRFAIRKKGKYFGIYGFYCYQKGLGLRNLEGWVDSDFNFHPNEEK